MIYVFVDQLRESLDQSWFSFLRVFLNIEFRAVLAVLLSFTMVMLAGPRTIRWLLKQKIGDQPEFYNKDLNQIMQQKGNTPTMGGVLIIASILITTFLLADLSNFYIHMALICTVALCAIGVADDWLKLTTARRSPGSREGLYTWEKLVLQLGLAVVLGFFIYHHGITKLDTDPLEFARISRSLNLPFLKTWVWDPDARGYVPSPDLIELSPWLFVIIAAIVIVGSSNAVNLTDGMDGLATGVVGIVALTFVILTIIAGFDEGMVPWAKRLLLPYIPLSHELSIIAAAMVGSCAAFLWFNCSPAQVFMGDTGSLTLGGLLGFLAVVIRQEMLLAVVGGVLVLEAVSVILQVGFFKLSGGKRIFRCAPIHHHFHLGGWTEQQVVVRFWILTIIFAGLALATLRLR